MAGDLFLELISEADGAVLLELPVSVIVISYTRIVKTWEEEKVGGDILRDAKLKCILPFQFKTLI